MVEQEMNCDGVRHELLGQIKSLVGELKKASPPLPGADIWLEQLMDISSRISALPSVTDSVACKKYRQQNAATRDQIADIEKFVKKILCKDVTTEDARSFNNLTTGVKPLVVAGVFERLMGSQIGYHVLGLDLDTDMELISMSFGLLQECLVRVRALFPSVVSKVASGLGERLVRELARRISVTENFATLLERLSAIGAADVLFAEFGDDFFDAQLGRMLTPPPSDALGVLRSFSRICEFGSPGDFAGLFVDGLLVPAVDRIQRFLHSSGDSVLTVNSLLFLVQKLLEVDDLLGGEFADVRRAKVRCESDLDKGLKELGDSMLSRFAAEGAGWLQAAKLSEISSQVLNTALSAIGGQLTGMEAELRRRILSQIGETVDRQVYASVVRRGSWTKRADINRLSSDIDALAAFFGLAPLRLLRSARIVLTQKEEPDFEVELNETEVEWLLTQG